MKKKIGLYFGSFNPIHIGHIDVAEKSLDFVDMVHFVVSPHNPEKDPLELVSEYHRLNMIKLSIKENDRFIESDIEFKLSKPNYTYQTLRTLDIENDYYLIMGSDCLNQICNWQYWTEIIKYPIICHIRDNQKLNNSIMQMIDNGMINISILKSDSIISSTAVRKMIKVNNNISSLVNPIVDNYIKINNLYE